MNYGLNRCPTGTKGAFVSFFDISTRNFDYHDAELFVVVA